MVMTDEFGLASAFILGLMGAPHCAGMCGGIVGALTMGCQPDVNGRKPVIVYILFYNLGRIISYVVAGALIAGISQFAANLVSLNHAQTILKVVAIIFMLFMGLYLGGWWTALGKLEKTGGHLWRFIEPVGRRFIPIRSVWTALAAGMVWGWLPCGLVYTGLIYSSSAGNSFYGGLLMLFFGLGTLPIMFSMGLAGMRLQRWLQLPRTRHLAGTLVICFAGYMFYQLWL